MAPEHIYLPHQIVEPVDFEVGGTFQIASVPGLRIGFFSFGVSISMQAMAMGLEVNAAPL